MKTFFSLTLTAVLAFWAMPAAAASTGRTVTVYQGGFALISEERSVKPGDTALRVEPVSPMLDPGTVVLTSPGPTTIREQVFLPANLGYEELLRAHLGKKVFSIRVDPATGKEIVREAVVLKADNGPVFAMDGRIETALPGRIAFPTAPEHLAAAPALHFKLSAERASPVVVSYLSDGLGWQADYVAVLSPDQSRLSLTTLATLYNHTGILFEDAQLRFVAGQVRRHAAGMPAPAMARGKVARAMMAAESDAVSGPVATGEYHLYALQEKADVLLGANQQFVILQAPAVAVESALLLQSQVSPYPAAREEQRNLHPRLKLTFENSAKNRLHQPLPAGTVRLYQNSPGGPVFLGEDRMGSVAAGERAELQPGEAFDVTVHRKQVAFERLAPSARRDDRPVAVAVRYQLEIANAKSEPATVVIEELIPGDWRITDESFEHSKPSSGVARWRLRLAPSEKKTLHYEARIQM